MTLWPRIRGLVLFGWLVALLRFGLEPTAKPAQGDVAWILSVYFLMPVAFVWTGIRGTFDDLRWPKIALIAALIGILVWAIPNAIIYTTAQFLGWTHGRFAPNDRAAPLATTTLGRLGAGLGVAGMTAIAGAIWSLVWMTLVVWLPGVVRRRRKTKPA
jgi:hypothetical protein